MQPEQDPAGIRDEFCCKSQAGAFAGSSIRIWKELPGSAASSQGGLRCLNTVGKRIPRINNIFPKSQTSAGAVEPRCGGDSEGTIPAGNAPLYNMEKHSASLSRDFFSLLSFSLALVQLPFDLGKCSQSN